MKGKVKSIDYDTELSLEQVELLNQIACPVSAEIEVDWKKLREKFFEECVIDSKIPQSNKRIPKVDMAPHDLFEWFKRELG